MKKTIISLLLIFASFWASSQNQKIELLLDKYQKSYNNRDFNQFANLIVDTFTIGGNWWIFSTMEAFALIDYPYLYEDVKEIIKIDINSIEKIDSQKVRVDIVRTFSKYIDTNLVSFEAELGENGYYLFTSFNTHFVPTTKTTKYTNASYGIDPETFNKWKIRHIDVTTQTEKLKGNVYAEEKFNQYVDTINTILNYIKQYSIEKAGFNTSVESYSVLEDPGYTTVYIHDKESYIGSIDYLTGIFEDDLFSIRKELFCFTTHESVETNLHKNFHLTTVNNRWYTDGFSEYMVYSISKDNDTEIWNQHCIGGGDYKSRKEEYEKFKQTDNLLDWAIDRRYQDVNPLVGKRYSYDDDTGQYGRALQFFLDFVEDYGEEKIRDIHKHFADYEKNVTQTELLNYISEITGEDIKERIANY